jgi:hypothetical protein
MNDRFFENRERMLEEISSLFNEIFYLGKITLYLPKFGVIFNSAP